MKYSFSSRFREGAGTNPEELIGAALAGCFSMALSLMLGDQNFKPEKIETEANVEIKMEEDKIYISTITLNTNAKIPGIEKEEFRRIAYSAKDNCPVSQALKGVEIKLIAELT